MIANVELSELKLNLDTLQYSIQLMFKTGNVERIKVSAEEAKNILDNLGNKENLKRSTNENSVFWTF